MSREASIARSEGERQAEINKALALPEVAGDAAQVHSLVGPNADAHVFEPTPADAQRLAKAESVSRLAVEDTVRPSDAGPVAGTATYPTGKNRALVVLEKLLMGKLIEWHDCLIANEVPALIRAPSSQNRLQTGPYQNGF